MHKLTAGLIAFAFIPAFAGCSTSDTLHYEGVTSYAGNAIAANTALQMVDPWPYGAQDTDLETPAERYGQDSGADSGAGDSSGANP